MKRTAVFALLMLTVCAAFAASAAEGAKKFELTRNNAAVKAGEIVKTRLVFECEEGAELGNWKAVVLRKNAPEAFFAKPEVKIKTARKPGPYDAIWFCPEKNAFPRRLTSGDCPVRINTAGMSAGDYAIIIQGWVLKDRKSFYPATVFYLSVTEEDNGKFAPTAQEFPAAARIPAPPAPAWYKSFALKPAMPVGAPGAKIPVGCEFAALDGEWFGGYSVFLLRKDAAPGFFDRADLKIKRRHPDRTDHYDEVTLIPFQAMDPVPEAKFDFTLDTAGFPEGEYVLLLRVRLLDRATGRTRYPALPLPLSLR